MTATATAAAVDHASATATLEANKAVIRRLFGEDLRGDGPDLAEELFHPAFVDHTNPPDMQHGVEGHRAIATLFKGCFPDMRWAVHDLIAEGDRVVARTTMTGTQRGAFFGIPATGRAVEVGGVHILRLQDGKIVEHWGVNDDLAMMRQLGAVPS